MRIFGIDPGSERTGYGCIDTDGSKLTDSPWIVHRPSVHSATLKMSSRHHGGIHHNRLGVHRGKRERLGKPGSPQGPGLLRVIEQSAGNVGSGNACQREKSRIE